MKLEQQQREAAAAAASSSSGGGGKANAKALPLTRKQRKQAEQNLIKELKADISELKANIRMKAKFAKDANIQGSDVMFTTGGN